MRDDKILNLKESPNSVDIPSVIQAGGMGTRLRPYSLVLPKPLMPVSGTPVLELTIKWLRRNGIKRTFITLGHLGSLIKSVCGNGSQWDIDIEYSEESEPLGTIGPLLLIGKERLHGSFLLLNGDLITDLDLREFIRHHRREGALLSVAVTNKQVKIDLGVLECENGRVVAFREKPVHEFKVSMGIYCLESEVLDLVPAGIPFGFDDLMLTMLDKGLPVNVFEHKGLWMDIGRPDDFAKAQEVVSNNWELIYGG